MPSARSRRQPTIRRTPVVLAASWARTMPARLLRSTMASASMPSMAAWANNSSQELAPRKKLKCEVHCSSERVDETRDVRLRFLGQRGDRLFRRKRLGERGGKAHDLDAEARIDRFDLVAEEPSQTLHVAHRRGRADADGLDAVVDAMKQKVEAPRAEAFGLEGRTELGDELGRLTGNCLRRADRIGEDATSFNECRRANRVNRLPQGAPGLNE